MAERNHLITPSGPGAAQNSERSPDEIRQHIAATRESISQTVDRLSSRFHEAFEWRTYVANYPLVAVGAAACVGILISGLFKRRPTPGERISEALAETVEDVAGRFRHQFDRAGVGHPGLSATIKAAAVGVITRAATDYLRDRLAQESWEEPDPAEVVISPGDRR